MSEESKSVEVELEELKQTSAALFAMARLVPWIAFCWNDHNYLKNPEQYARECCAHYGITDIDKANEWLDGKPFINKESYQLPSQEIGGTVPTDAEIIAVLEKHKLTYAAFTEPSNKLMAAIREICTMASKVSEAEVHRPKELLVPPPPPSANINKEI